jgi:hypothetical protein
VSGKRVTAAMVKTFVRVAFTENQGIEAGLESVLDLVEERRPAPPPPTPQPVAPTVVDQRGEQYLTTEEVAEIARTGASTVRFWRMNGTGPRGIKRGRRVLYPRSVVEAWLRGDGGDS